MDAGRGLRCGGRAAGSGCERCVTRRRSLTYCWLMDIHGRCWQARQASAVPNAGAD